jgi:hypothetical protein
MAATRVERWANVILLGACMFFALFLSMRNLFGVGVVLGWGLTLVARARKGRWTRSAISPEPAGRSSAT